MKQLSKNPVTELRQNLSDAEQHLWYLLRAKRLKGYKIRRQHLISPYVVDFVCLKKKLVIELDGGQHMEAVAYDYRRSLFLKKLGFRVIRFWNDAVFNETEAVLTEILKALEEK